MKHSLPVETEGAFVTVKNWCPTCDKSGPDNCRQLISPVFPN